MNVGVDVDYDKAISDMQLIKKRLEVYLDQQRKRLGCKVSVLKFSHNSQLCFDRRPLQKCRSVRILRSSFEAQTCADNDVKNICLGNLFLGYG